MSQLFFIPIGPPGMDLEHPSTLNMMHDDDQEDDRQEEAEVGEDKHLCSIFNLHAGK